MRPVGIVAGADGRLLAKDGVVAFLDRPDAALLKMLAKSPSNELFAAVLAHIAGSSSRLPSFVVVDRTTNHLLMRGPFRVSNGSEIISLADPASCQERHWDSNLELSVGLTTTGLAPLTFLREGCVPASGFALRPEPATKNSDVEAKPHTAASSAQPARTVAPAILEDPGIDLALIGRREPAQIEPVQDPDVPLERAPAPEPATESDNPQDPIDDMAGEADTAPAVNKPTRRFRPPPSTSSRRPGVTNDTPRHVADGHRLEQVALLRFSDGQSCKVAKGILIGRYPSKRGVPHRYNTVTLTGDEVSRVHVEVRVERNRAFARDLRTPNGTTLRSDRGLQDLAVTEPGTELEPGDIIEFAGQRIFFDGWESHA